MIPFINTPVQHTTPFQPEWKGVKNEFVEQEIVSLLHKGSPPHTMNLESLYQLFSFVQNTMDHFA